MRRGVGYDVTTGNDGVTGLWCRDILAAVMQATPHVWPRHTLDLFPAPVREFFGQYANQRDDKQQLKVQAGRGEGGREGSVPGVPSGHSSRWGVEREGKGVRPRVLCGQSVELDRIAWIRVHEGGPVDIDNIIDETRGETATAEQRTSS